MCYGNILLYGYDYGQLISLAFSNKCINWCIEIESGCLIGLFMVFFIIEIMIKYYRVIVVSNKIPTFDYQYIKSFLVIIKDIQGFVRSKTSLFVKLEFYDYTLFK